MQDIRQVIRGQVHQLVGRGDSGVDLTRPEGDPGLFGPDSAAWKVHGDFTAMMIGGISSLLVQMLHPGALAGVWDHSNFRRDMQGRLRRTAQFIAGTTYGSTESATRLIDRVRRIHDHVTGALPDGTPYSANDPALLTWVHVAETDSFLRGYLRYRNPGFSAADQDRYCTETATLARRLGATDVPESRRAIDAYLAAIRPRLVYDARTRDVARALLSQPSPSFAMAPMRAMMMQAGIDLMPDWAAAMHGRRVPHVQKPGIRLGAQGLGTVLRWALA